LLIRYVLLTYTLSVGFYLNVAYGTHVVSRFIRIQQL